MFSRLRLFTLVPLALLWLTPAFGSEQLSQLLVRLFDKHEFDVKSFGPARWVDGGAGFTTLEPCASNKEARDIVRYETESGKREVLVGCEALSPSGGKPLAIEDYTWSKDTRKLLIFTNSKRVWRSNTKGDYWLLDRDTGKLVQLGGKSPASSLMFAKFSPDGARAAYVSGNNLYVEDLKSHAIRRLTADGSDTLVNGTSDWVYEEEFGLRDGFRWNPDGQSIAYWQFDSSRVKEFTIINNTGDIYPKLITFPYPKAGQTNSAVRVGVVGTKGGRTKWMEVPGDPRENYVVRMEWTGDGRSLVIEHMNRLQNNCDLLLADAKSGETHSVFHDQDAAWIDYMEGIEWRKKGGVIWLSERDGWRHAYEIPMDGKAAKLLTASPADVAEIYGSDEAGEWLYYSASPGNATQRYLFRTRADGSGTGVRLSPAEQPGTHEYTLSPDCRWAFHTYSNAGHPPITDLVSLPDHRAIRVLEDNAALVKAAAALSQPPKEFFQLGIGGGVELDGWMLKPHGFDAARKYPVLVYVYGEPAGVTVTDQWQGDVFLRGIANDGYLVVSFDNRGTPSLKGREWRKCVYGSIGPLAAQDQTAAVRALAKERSYVDLNRVAVWGWSGGGTNTLNLMFRSPDLFKVGIAVAPVPDQRLYDSIYQERYMGLPDQNAPGYKQGSAINFAEGLSGKLLLIHGSGDDNVHFQGSQLLINRLVELGKPFDFMEYPNRSHGIFEGPGTSLHLYNLIARYLEDHLRAGPD
jgi:dipeptidyl-peptidase-4